MAATAASCQALWLRKLLSEVTKSESKSVTLSVDNKYTIALMKNQVFHERSKHIDTLFHFIHEYVEKRQIVVEFICTRELHADILTKTLVMVSNQWWSKFSDLFRNFLVVFNVRESLGNLSVFCHYKYSLHVSSIHNHKEITYP